MLCLQEVTELGIRSTFLSELGKIGLTCAGFSLARDDRQQGSRLPLQPTGYDNWTLGCAVFCKSTLVDVVASKRVYLKDFMPEIVHSPNLLNDLLLKDNTMVMALIKLKSSGQHMLVANTHLFWDPERADIKSLQACAAIRAMDKMAASYKLTDKPLARVLCGDLNAMPLRDGASIASIGHDDDYFSHSPSTVGTASDSATVHHLRSGVHELLTTGRLSDQHPEHPDRWYTRVLSTPTSPQLGPLTIAAPLKNTFCSSEFAPYAPTFTTKTNEFQGWLDHIWVNDQVSVTHSLVPPVCRKHLRAAELSQQYPPLPNEVRCFYCASCLSMSLAVDMLALSARITDAFLVDAPLVRAEPFCSTSDCSTFRPLCADPSFGPYSCRSRRRPDK